MNSLKYFLLLLVLPALFTGCDNGSSSGNQQVSATASEAKTMFSSVGEFSKMGAILDYADTKESGGDLTPAQEEALINCTKSDVTNGDSSNFSTQVNVAGTDCPISYQLKTSGTKIGTQIDAKATISYKVLKPSFSELSDLQSADCSLAFKATESEYMNMSASMNCLMDSTANGPLSIAATVKVESSLNSKSIVVNATLSGGGKTVVAKITMQTLNGVTTKQVVLNGQAVDDSTDLNGLTGLF